MRETLPIADAPAVRRYARQMARRHPRELGGAVALHVGAAVAGLAAPRLIGNLVQDVSEGTTVSTVDKTIMTLAVFLLAQTVLTRYARFASFALGEKVLAELRENFVKRSLALPVSTVERAGTGDLLTRTSRDVEALGWSVRFAVPDDMSLAQGRAMVVYEWELALNLAPELALNAAVSSLGVLAVFCSYAYATLHYVVTPAVLVWLYLISLAVLRVGPARALRIYGQSLKQLWSAIVTIATILGLAYLLNYSGLTYTLGLAFAATGVFFPFFASFIGWLGVALTGSDTSSNALFANLQKVTAQQIGVSPILTVGANSSGGVLGKMISPQNLAVGTSATGLQGREGDLLRLVLKWSLGLTVVMAILVTLQAYVFPFVIP